MKKAITLLLLLASIPVLGSPPVIWNGSNAKFLNSGTVIIPGATAHGVLVGQGSSAITSVQSCTTGQLLTCNSNGGADPSWANNGSVTAPTTQKFTSTGTTTGYLFTVTAANATVGATYTNNSHTYTVLGTISAGTQLFCSGASAPTASGTLTKATGTGDSSITFSANRALATYTTPTNPAPLYIRVRMIGGGGGAGGGQSPEYGAGGGSGAYVESIITSPAGSYPYVVGTGGSGGSGASNGTSGNDSVFGANANVGGGGTGGDPGQGSTGGAGGTATLTLGSGLAVNGGGGGGTGNTSNITAGWGGVGFFGGAGLTNNCTTGGNAAANSGAGGGGGCGSAAGGNGGTGIVIVDEFYQ